MIIRLTIISFLFSVSLNSCIVKNTTRKKKCPDTCNKNHKLTGKKALVGTRYGKLKAHEAYELPYAKQPHPMGCVVPIWPIYRLAKIYVCDSCTILYKKNKRLLINESW